MTYFILVGNFNGCIPYPFGVLGCKVVNYQNKVICKHVLRSSFQICYVRISSLGCQIWLEVECCVCTFSNVKSGGYVISSI
jgi:hypothetical protein